MDDEKRCETCGFWKRIDQVRKCTKLILTGNTYSIMLTEVVDKFVGEHPRTLPAFYCVYWEGIPRTFTIKLTPLDADRVQVEVLTPGRVHDFGPYPIGYSLRSLLETIQRRGIEGNR